MAHIEKEEEIMDNNLNQGQEMDEIEHIAKLRHVRRGKLAHLTKRKNIMIELMEDVSYVQEVKDNFMKYKQLLDDFKTTHEAYLELLSEEEAVKDEHEWFKPKMAEINEFLSSVFEWLSGISKVEAVGFQEMEVGPKDSASQVESRASSVASARIQAEAERAALMVKMAALKEKHDLEEKEEALNKEMQSLKHKREALELKTQLEASSSKLAVLASAVEEQDDAELSLTANPLTEEHQPSAENPPTAGKANKTVPSVRPKAGAHFQPVLVQSDGLQAAETFSIPAVSKRASDHFVTSSQSSISHDKLTNILQCQNDITTILVKQQQLSNLPHKEIPVFSGDVLSYRPFIRAFEHAVELKTDNDADRLYFLDQYTSHLPRDLVRSCLHMSPDRGYRRAKALLKEHYGDEFKICSAYMKKALEWPAIKAEDTKALQAFTIFLRSCCNVMEEMKYSGEINLSSNMKHLTMKLPYKLRERWRSHVCEFEERRNSRPRFTDLVEFLEKQVRIVSDPVYGDIQDRPTRGKEMLFTKTKPKSNRSSFATSVSTAVSQPAENPQKTNFLHSCCLCSGNHTLEHCSAFQEKRHRDKVNFLKEKGLCFGCLEHGHISKHCRHRHTCSVCSKLHPTALHMDKIPNVENQRQSSKTEATLNPSKETGPLHPKACGHIGAGPGAGNVLSVVPVKVKAGKGQKVMEVYAFIDPGSTDTFCTERLMSQLNLNGRKSNILLKTMSHEKLVPTYIVSDLEVSGLDENNFIKLPDTFTQKEMPVTADNIPRKQDLARWSYLHNVKIPEIDSSIELLIGTNAHKIMEPWEIVNSQGNGPYAVKTLVGWIINGPLKGGELSGCSDCPHAPTVNKISVANLEKLVISQYNHDFNEKASEEKRELSQEDKRFLQIANDSVSLLDGHYVLNLPFRKDDVQMPNNRHIVMQRLLSLQRKFKRNKSFHKEYTACLNDVIATGYAEIVPQVELNEADGRTWYIPHHGVYHPKKKTLRVVFDCGAAYQGRSLNSELLQGPDLTNSIIGVLLRFRLEPVALTADIKSMFHQVRVSKPDINFLRFLWWPEGDIEQDPVDHRMLVHIFGAVSSPSCASFALRRTAEDNSHYRRQVTDTIMKNFYVDDCLTSVPTVQEAVQLASDLVDLCSKGGFQLTKWVSNSRAVLLTIKEEERGKDIRSLDLDKDQLPIDRALGLQWSMEDDTFRFGITVPEKPHTRRGLLSMVSSVFDPLGILSPLTLPAKQLLQQLCKQSYGWDEPIPAIQSKQWINWIQDLPKLADFNVRRCIKPSEFGKPHTFQLHHFADASEAGYGAVSYLRMTNDRDEIHVSFMVGKARVAPLKQMTIPRLELTAAVLSVRLDKMLKKELQLPLESSLFWTDSQAMLKFIANESARFHTFVANRVSAIRENSDIQQWRFISSKQNPADEASRGLSVSKFMENRRWIHGPEFLWEPKHTWPAETENYESLSQDDPEVKGHTVVCNISVQDVSSPTHKLLHFFSDWTRLLRAVAWYQRLGKILLALAAKRKELGPMVNTRSQQQRLTNQLQAFKSTLNNQPLTLKDLGNAERDIILYTQKQAFQCEYEKLARTPSSVQKTSPIFRLDPVLKDGLLKVGGRLSRAAMSETIKHPIILPKRCHISDLLLRHIHERYGHCGRNYILCQLRKKYWIINGNSAARRVISKCIFCRKLKGKTGEQKMADLPLERTLPDLPPFTHVGMDYFGPIETKRGRGLVKRYGVLFTCMSSRAVHLEMASSLNTDSCIHAIRRFICRRGQVKHIWSDNGTNLVSAEKELRKALSNLSPSRIQDAMMDRAISWSFNPPGAPHHGGVWERLIKSVKWVLNSLLHQQIVDDEGLHTLLCEVEAILNSRPITTTSSDPFDLEPLTPNHILLLNSQPVLPPGEFSKADSYSRRRWKQIQYLADLFWKRWTKEYLTLMQERQKWSNVKKNFNPGDIVVIVDPTSPRSSWPLGRILETRPDSKGLVRSVKLRTKTGILERPITKLCLLLEEK